MTLDNKKSHTNRFWKAVFVTTLIARTLDITGMHLYQGIVRGAFPDTLFCVIAAVGLGVNKVLNIGPVLIALGVLIHYIISFVFTFFFYLLYPAVARVSRNKYVSGLWYTIIVWLTMNVIVLPLSSLARGPFVYNLKELTGFLIFLAAFGMHILLMTHKYHKRRILR